MWQLSEQSISVGSAQNHSDEPPLTTPDSSPHEAAPCVETPVGAAAIRPTTASILPSEYSMDCPPTLHDPKSHRVEKVMKVDEYRI